LIVVGLVVGVVALRRAVGLEFDPESVRSFVEALGAWAPLAYVGVVAFRIPLGLPSAIVLIAGGVLFGGPAGTLYGAAGLMLTALMVFGGARWGGRDAVAARLPERLRPLLEIAGSRLGAVFIALATAYPMSVISLCHLLAGITRMSLPVFVVAAGVGALGRAALYTYFGSSLLEADLGRILLATFALLAAMLVPLAFATPRAWLLQTLARPPAPAPEPRP
jgi:uncharacterized membrane protein YdjX (TVP38/TMEM64 family)